jgi:cytochrome b involved in lipid metabolism
MKLTANSIVVLTAVFLCAVSIPSQAATIAGTKCTKVGTTKTVSKVKYVCVKSGTKLIWNTATAVLTTPSTKPSISTFPSASPNGDQTQLTLEEIKKHDSGTSCWSIVYGNVFDLTKWIAKHPGGAAVIRAICGKDGTIAFEGQHAGQGKPANQLSNNYLGKLGESIKL